MGMDTGRHARDGHLPAAVGCHGRRTWPAGAGPKQSAGTREKENASRPLRSSTALGKSDLRFPQQVACRHFSGALRRQMRERRGGAADDDDVRGFGMGG